jgi:catechol 2,3-dioxygenase-like lactoylglutathione lyase family enzyme
MRTRRVLRFLILFLAILPSAAAQLVTSVDAVGMTVSDMDRSVDFYTRVLHFTKVSDTEVHGDGIEHVKGVFGARLRIVRLRLGDEFLELSEYIAPRGRPIPVDFRSNDRWFQHVAIITRDMDKAYAWLRKNKVQHASSGPQRLPNWNPNAGGIQAFYFRDPDGHHLEILAFPADKGDKKWHRAGSDLFMGIDHTAIVVGDTERSLAFYRDTLGMRVAGESENYGIEQERLNNVFGARLRITSLRAARGPGVEFLEYLTPRDGRPVPEDWRANDLAHWETTFRTADAEQAWKALSKRTRLVSSRAESPIENLSPQFLAKDPDGHVVALIGSESKKREVNDERAVATEGIR